MRSLYAAAVRCTDGFGTYCLNSFSGPIPSLSSTRFRSFQNRRRTGSSDESLLETWEVKNPQDGYVFPTTEKYRGATRIVRSNGFGLPRRISTTLAAISADNRTRSLNGPRVF